MATKLQNIGTIVLIEEVEKPTIICDYEFKTDKVIHHCCLDIIVLDNSTNNCHIIDVAIPNDKNIANKVTEKIYNLL